MTAQLLHLVKNRSGAISGFSSHKYFISIWAKFQPVQGPAVLNYRVYL